MSTKELSARELLTHLTSISFYSAMMVVSSFVGALVAILLTHP